MAAYPCRVRLAIVAALGVTIGAYMAMGCGSSGSGSASPTESGGGNASATSLSTVPSVDLTNYDSTTSTTSSNISAPEKEVATSKSVGLKGPFGTIETKPHQEGLGSRAGCEYNMHKQEIIRHSQIAQLDRCYPEAMEKGGLITIPSGSYAYYGLSKPAESNEDRRHKCEGIPSDMAAERAKCQEGKEGAGAGDMKLRIGRFDNELRVNLCQGGAQTSSGVYTVTSGSNGATASIQAINTRSFNGHTDKVRFTATGKGLETIANGIITRWNSTEGDLSASMAISGGFGQGTNAYDYNPITGVTTLAGYFASSFTDQRNNAPTAFSGKVYTKADGTNGGCSKYSFTGGPPPMKVKDMVPFNVSSANLSTFLQSLSLGMGISITTSNYQTLKLCMNPDYNPDSPGMTRPMVAANSDGSCPTVTHTGTECFSITNTTVTDPFGKRNKVEQIFKMVANSAVSYYAAVNAFDLGTISTDIGAFTHLNDWDCAAGSGGFSEVSFAAPPSAAQLTALMAAIQECNSLEGRARGNSGMGGYNCTGGDQNKIVSKQAERPPETGKYGGEMVVSTNNCGTGGSVSTTIPNRLFLEQQDVSSNLYCLPNAGTCTGFNISENPVSVLSKAIKFGDYTLKGILFTLANNKATGGTITFQRDQFECTATFSTTQHQFSAQSAPTQANQFPKECVEKGLTDMAKCGEYCDPKKGHTCTPPS